MNLTNIADMIIGILSFVFITLILSIEDKTVKQVRYRFLLTAILYCIALICIWKIRQII
ncbi:hypothetical protein [Clostridium botulinum]|uniref:hypothetical protein n=1 Tax=Clostridium botulinum TaxID=1491 RepID=UPI000B074E26|nr:hypothetical protein [Clostridium botulinum]